MRARQNMFCDRPTGHADGKPALGHPVPGRVIGKPHRATAHDMLYWNARAELPADLAPGILLGVTAMILDSAGEHI